MELNPYSLVDNTLRVFFRGLQEPIVFSVSSETTYQVRDALCLIDDKQEDYFDYIQVPLVNESLVLLSTDHVIVLQHLFDHGMPVVPPPPRKYGDLVPDDVAEKHGWFHPQAVIGVEGFGVMELHDQSRESLGTLIDSVQEGFPIGPFLEFTDDDRETVLVVSNHLAFALVDREMLRNKPLP